MSYGCMKNNNCKIFKQSDYLIVSNLINEIKKSEQIRLKAFGYFDNFTDDFFNILNKVIQFSFQLTKLLKNTMNYDNVLKQNKTKFNIEIRNFLDKICSLPKLKTKYIFLKYNIEKQDNFSIINLKKRKNELLNKQNKRNVEIIPNYKKINSSKLFLSDNKSNYFSKNVSLTQTKLSKLNYKDIPIKKMRSCNSTILIKNNSKKNEINHSYKEDSTNKSSLSHSKMLTKKNKNLNKNTLNSKENNRKTISNIKKQENYSYVNYLKLFFKKNKNIKKQKLEINNPLISKIQLINSGPKPSIYTNYLLNKYKDIIETYNEIEEKNYKNYSPNSMRYQTHSLLSDNRRCMSESIGKNEYEEI